MKANVNGKEVEVEKISFVPLNEPWGELHLEDGTILKTKIVVTKVVKVLGERNPDGSPMYSINHQVIFATEAPEPKDVRLPS